MKSSQGGYIGIGARRASSAPAPFLPSSLTAVKYWLDAGKITGVADGGAIAATDVVDQSRFALGAFSARVNLTYRADVGNGKPAIEFNGVDSYGRSPSFVITQPHTVFAVMKQIVWASGKRFWDGNTVNRSLCQTAGITPQLGIYAGTATTPNDLIMDIGYVSMFEASYNGASSTVRTNGNVASTADPGSLGFNDGAIFGAAGGLNAGFFANYQLLEWIVCDSTLTANDKLRIRAYLNAKHQLYTRSVLVFDGNSLTAGSGASNPQADGSGTDYPSRTLALLGGLPRFRHKMFGVAGQGTPAMTADAAAQIDIQVLTFARAVCVAWEVTNDIVVNAADAATAYNNFVTYCTGRRSAGFKVVALTVLPRSNFTAPMITIKDTVNTNIRANWATFADALADVAADARLSNFADTTYFSGDGIHLNDTGYNVTAGIVYPAIVTVL